MELSVTLISWFRVTDSANWRWMSLIAIEHELNAGHAMLLINEVTLILWMYDYVN